MKGLPIDLLLVLFLGAVVLFNFIRQRAAGQRAPEAPEAEPEPDDDMPEALWGRGPPLEPAPEAEPAMPLPAPRRVPAPAAVPAGRRFGRRALLGSRRQVQDAFVVATILGRCRADEPHEVR